MNATTKEYQFTKLTEAVKEVRAAMTPLLDMAGSFSISRGETCCKVWPTATSIMVECAQGLIEVTNDSVPTIRTALNIGLIRPLLDQVCANTTWVVKPYRRSDTWEIFDSQDKEVTVEVAMGGCYTEPDLCIAASRRNVKVLTVANLRKHITAAMSKARANIKYHRDQKANEVECRDVKALFSKGINDAGVTSTKERDIRYSDGYGENEGETGGTWSLTVAYKRDGLEAKFTIQTSLLHAYAAGTLFAKRILATDKI